MVIFCWILLGHLIFGLLLMDYLSPGWHPFEKLVGAMIWPVPLAVGIGMMVSGLRKKRKERAVEAHTVFHLKAQLRYMDICDGYGGGGIWQ